MNQTSDDEKFMRRCLQLACGGLQNARPNPMVGAVIVASGRIIGEGYHVRCGEGHAEVNAFASVRPDDEKLLPQATVYVSLEPCSHYGKTPPCADLIIKKGVRRVVVGCIDFIKFLIHNFCRVHHLHHVRNLFRGKDFLERDRPDDVRHLTDKLQFVFP